MPNTKPTTVAQYMEAAPAAGKAHLHALYELLKAVAPNAQEAIKWGNPFFVEPRFLFAFSAHKNHLSFAPSAEAMHAFNDEIKLHLHTTHFLKIPYTATFPEDLIRRMAHYCVEQLKKRESDSFW